MFFFTFKICVLLSVSLISIPAKSEKNQPTNLDSGLNQNIKAKKNFRDNDSLLKQIESAREKLKSEEFRLKDIQNRIINRRSNSPK